MNQRVYKLISILLEETQPITVDALASKVNASNKTIRLDLNKIADICKENNLLLSRKQGVGVSVDGDISDKLRLKNVINNSSYKRNIHQ